MTSNDRDHELLSALLDGELSEKETTEMTTRMQHEPALRRTFEKLEGVRAATKSAFGDMIGGAPQPPSASEVFGPRDPGAEEVRRPDTRRDRWVAIITVLTAAAAVPFAVLLMTSKGRTPIPADPAAFFQHAASQFLELRDAELYATFSTEGVSILKSLFEKDKQAEDRPTRIMRVLMKAPDYFLVHPVANTRSTAVAPGEITGFDGNRAWTYDPATNEITLDKTKFRVALANEKTTTTMTLDKSSGNFFKLLTSWDSLAEVARGKGATIVETTGPADERVGRRVFVFSPDEKSKDRKWAMQNFRVTVDAKHARIERLEYDFRVIGLSLIKCDVQLARTDLGLTASDFQMNRYTPRNATVANPTGASKEALR